MEWANTYRVLEEFGSALREAYRRNLAEKGVNTTRHSLSDSVSWHIEADERDIELSLSLLDYWKYVEYGTKPHWAPEKPIAEWIRIKPVLPQPDRNGRIPTPKQLNYLIRRKIAREGTQPGNVLKDSLDEVLTRFYDDLEEAVTKDVAAYIDLTLLRIDY